MTKDLLFWILMILWLVLGFVWHWDLVQGGRYRLAGGSALLFVLVALLGWRVFGPPIK